MTVVGGGLIGAAIAYGAARKGVSVRVLDQGDVAFRASRGNFGLVWVQDKGDGVPQYARWSREASKLWSILHNELLEVTGVDTDLKQPGGFWLAFSEAEMVERVTMLDRIDRDAGGIPFKMMEYSDLKQHLPGLGPAVVGGSYCPLDGHANPLMLLRGLHTALKCRGAELVTGVDVERVRHNADRGGFEIYASDGRSWSTDRVVLAAGLGNARLGPQIGLHAPVVPSRGQILISERVKPFLHYPINKFRQTGEGSVQIGSTTENVGLDDGTTTDRIKWMAKRAVATFPALADARIVRAWGALRILSPDEYPIYEESQTCPGGFIATSHSGVTLASVHCLVLAPWMCGLAELPPDLSVFTSDRFSEDKKGFAHAN